VENSFDVIKVDVDETLIWIEAAESLTSAKIRARELVSWSPGEYLVFDQGTQELVATFSPRSETEQACIASRETPLEDDSESLLEPSSSLALSEAN
jgi:hypothetical protein